MNKFVDVDGRVYVWWTGKEVDTEGEFKKIRFTIKDHKEYKGEYQTGMSRAKVM